ncbi:hypothetical protein FRACYDRAFT_245006 [Fragilariopsis cylindrus CCMP1102]|jgi:hypothetical protein|uniref:Uncharacterized protein n=1 Tax=Fragilariopsis cylindrus CCMP1102 TaxID=635003 RepID=A0A1E7F194_9STRA|nr:hypothetical protein FRACYDRAFT_245006 [Fragilariopsis cylindrus CCMP1102]|eukprot:OEU11886.1 hypothetical protein FRACYDRAFT_245006 [Fragilariopsis cylindrus CCMP1102]
MISHITFRNFMVMMAIVSPSSLNAFNLSKKPLSSPSLPAIDVTDGQLNAANVDNSGEDSTPWSSLTQMIHSKIDFAEAKDGTPLSDEAKDEIIATAVAGSVLGTAVGSPLIIGAALGYAGSQMLTGEKGDKARQVLGQASKAAIAQANSAIVFTKNELENEKDLSKVSKKILLAIQEKADTVQTDFKKSPKLMADQMKANVLKTVASKEFKTLPKRSFQAFRTFLESDEVKNVSSSAMKALKDGIESDEMKALQSRASKSLKDTIDSKK